MRISNYEHHLGAQNESIRGWIDAERINGAALGHTENRMSPTVFLLPGLACDARVWREAIPPLLAAGHRVQVSDVHVRFDSLAGMAAALLAEAGREPLVLVGTSMGGMLALEVWRLAPERVSALALLGTTARPDTPEMIRLRSEACELFAQGRVDEVLRANIAFALHSGHARLAELVADYLAMVRRAGAEALIRQNRAVMARPDYRPLLPNIRCPVLVMCGEDDLLTPVECSREIASAVPGAALDILPRCGHLLTMECGERVGSSIATWLAGVEAAPPTA